jgi:hypothetical protein
VFRPRLAPTPISMSAFPPLFGVERTFVRQAEIDPVDRCCRKSLLGGNKQDFLKLLMGFVRSDVGDLIAPQKNDHGPSYRHYRASQWRGIPKFTICEIFGVVRFSTFSTASTQSGIRGRSNLWEDFGAHARTTYTGTDVVELRGWTSREGRVRGPWIRRPRSASVRGGDRCGRPLLLRRR